MFGRIRSLLGDARNPTMQQFKGALRKIFFNNEINLSSKFANIIDSSNILEVSSVPKRMIHGTELTHNAVMTAHSFDEENEEDGMENGDGDSDDESSMFDANGSHFFEGDDDDDEEEHDLVPHIDQTCSDSDTEASTDENLQPCEDVSIASYARNIEVNIQKNHSACPDDSTCQNIFSQDERVSSLNVLQKSFTKHNEVPCRSTFMICKITREIFVKALNSVDFKYDDVFQLILENVSENRENIFPNIESFICGLKSENIFHTIIHSYVDMYAKYFSQMVNAENNEDMLRSWKERVRIFRSM
ncbi:uncharacterized protein LOC129572171 isoform X2 [Sitodiplosis mosellana]|nr:uncharacterized protein LOC129572171 isoform X2 [Sitodiplosis mosellana]XP_055308083.1 uncharacterized protein LOC129572171 isoform X2 [Sitodiplosis mosellana]